MHVIWRRECEFEDFIQSIVSDEKHKQKRLYLLVAAVESYFELLTRVLLGKIGGRMPKQEKAIACLVANATISAETAKIMNQVRRVRNSMLHDLLYDLPADRVVEFKSECFGETFNVAEALRLDDPDEREWLLIRELTRAYCQVVNACKHEVDTRISVYLSASNVR